MYFLLCALCCFNVRFLRAGQLVPGGDFLVKRVLFAHDQRLIPWESENASVRLARSGVELASFRSLLADSPRHAKPHRLVNDSPRNRPVPSLVPAQTPQSRGAARLHDLGGWGLGRSRRLRCRSRTTTTPPPVLVSHPRRWRRDPLDLAAFSGAVGDRTASPQREASSKPCGSPSGSWRGAGDS